MGAVAHLGLDSPCSGGKRLGVCGDKTAGRNNRTSKLKPQFHPLTMRSAATSILILISFLVLGRHKNLTQIHSN